MDSKSKLTLILALLGTVSAGAGGTFFLDFSSEDNSLIDQSTQIISTVLDEEAIAEAGMDIICDMDSIPKGYEDTCAEWNSED